MLFYYDPYMFSNLLSIRLKNNYFNFAYIEGDFGSPEPLT